MLRTLSGIAEGQAGQENNPNRRNGGACQICLRRMVVKVREPCRGGDKHLRERSHDRADNGADAKELRALNTARRNRERQRSHGNIEGRISNIKTYKQNSRVNDVEDQRGIGAADKEQDHHKRHKPRGPFDIGTHLAVLRAGAIHQNPHDGIVDRVKNPAKKADVGRDRKGLFSWNFPKEHICQKVIDILGAGHARAHALRTSAQRIRNCFLPGQKGFLADILLDNLTVQKFV